MRKRIQHNGKEEVFRESDRFLSFRILENRIEFTLHVLLHLLFIYLKEVLVNILVGPCSSNDYNSLGDHVSIRF